MTAGPRAGDAWDDDVVFRTLAAPGLEEDDLFAAMYGLPGSGLLWGEGLPSSFPPAEPPWDAVAERRRRHEGLLEKWPPAGERPGMG